jgi:DNA-binding NtrC family response regulator
MVSGTPSADIAQRSLTAGAFDYVVKPIDLGYLTQSVETALSMKQAGL